MIRLAVIAHLSEFAQLCDCGHSTDMHIDGEEQCVDVECGCRSFEEVCEFCGGEGVVTHEMFNPVTGYNTVDQKCICKIEE